ncbi:unnamed protein product [Lactuca virosa]|uniref:Uncharacterized protein n=1 Tax=Lactuca virosa TaxID=75947 RepID=A0AAU9N747_9ASTR|nr:unnamed protein product [Lactuca virosa]
MIFNMCIMSIRYKYVRTEEDFIITTHHPIHCIALDVVMRFEGDGEVGVDLRSTTIQISTSSLFLCLIPLLCCVEFWEIGQQRERRNLYKPFFSNYYRPHKTYFYTIQTHSV